jgi:hypothetical protein
MKGPANPERSFGVSVGGVLCVIAAVLAWRGRIARAEVLATIGGLLVIAGVAAPAILRVPNRWWMKLAHALGWFNTRLLLFVAFVVVFVPTRICMTLVGKDPLSRRRTSFPGWSPYPARYRDRTHYTRMY